MASGISSGPFPRGHSRTLLPTDVAFHRGMLPIPTSVCFAAGIRHTGETKSLCFVTLFSFLHGEKNVRPSATCHAAMAAASVARLSLSDGGAPACSIHRAEFKPHHASREIGCLGHGTSFSPLTPAVLSGANHGPVPSLAAFGPIRSGSVSRLGFSASSFLFHSPVTGFDQDFRTRCSDYILKWDSKRTLMACLQQLGFPLLGRGRRESDVRRHCYLVVNGPALASLLLDAPDNEAVPSPASESEPEPGPLPSRDLMQLYSCSRLGMGLVCMVVSVPTGASPGTEFEVSKVIQCTGQSEDRVTYLAFLPGGSGSQRVLVTAA